MTQWFRTRALSALALGAAFALASPQDAHAYQGVSAFACHVAQHDWPHTVASNQNGLENRSGEPNSRNMIVSCPVVNESVDLTAGFVTGIDGNNELSAVLGEFRVRSCSNNFNGEGFACSAFQTLRVDPSVVFVGMTDFPLAAGVLTELNRFGQGHRFLEISIPRPGVSGNSRLLGFEVIP